MEISCLSMLFLEIFEVQLLALYLCTLHRFKEKLINFA